MSAPAKDAPQRAERITAVAFVNPVDFVGLSEQHTWRADKHGPEAPMKELRSRVSVIPGWVVIEAIEPRPEGQKGARWRIVRVPITNVRYYHSEAE